MQQPPLRRLYDKSISATSPRQYYSFCPIPAFFFNNTATTEIYTLSLHDALPIFPNPVPRSSGSAIVFGSAGKGQRNREHLDRKSTRLNSSHMSISYAVFCLKKKKRPSVVDSVKTMTAICVNVDLKLFHLLLRVRG